MRVLGLLLLTLLLGNTGCESRKPKKAVTVPPAVTRTARTLFPRADSVRWEWDKDGFFEGRFVLPDSLHRKLRVSPEGRWLETETDVARTALPVPVQDTLQALLDRIRDRSQFRIRAVSIVQYADGHTEYEAQVRVGKKWRKRYYDAQGHLLREEKGRHG